MEVNDDARLSRLLFDAREQIEMWAAVIENTTGKNAAHPRRLVREIDEFRAERGWSPNGFGGEQATP